MIRHAFIGSTAATVATVMLGPISPARAAAGGNVPAVDRLVVTNIVDNQYDVFATDPKFADIAVQRTLPKYGQPGLVSEHGLAYHLASRRGNEQRQVLLDFAFTNPVLMQDYRVLGIDPRAADALIVSHGHNDHFGGLADLAGAGAAARAGTMLRPGTTLYAGGIDTFCHRVQVAPDDSLRDGGRLDRAALENAGVRVAIVPEPAIVAGHALTSGSIPRTTSFETIPATWGLALDANDPCASLHYAPMQVKGGDGTYVHDQMLGEHVTVYNVRDRGLVVLMSCGHAGTVNTLQHVRAITGVRKIHAVVGGMHLAAAPDEKIATTVAALKEIAPDYVAPMHCTGARAVAAMRAAMAPGSIIAQSTGTRFIFGA